MFFFWLNILVKPKVTVRLEANEVNLMIIQIRLCLLSNTRWQCSYNSIRKKKQNHRWTPMLPKLNNSGYYQSSCIFVRNEKKIKKNKTKKKNKRRKGKRKEKKRKLVHKHYATLAWGNCSHLLTSRTRTLSN